MQMPTLLFQMTTFIYNYLYDLIDLLDLVHNHNYFNFHMGRGFISTCYYRYLQTYLF
jgi:hypothetical protein